MGSARAPQNGEVPRRRHRRRTIWQGLEAGDAEHSDQARLEPLRRLIAGASCDPDFLVGLKRVLVGELSAAELASRYVARGKRGDIAHRGMTRFIERAVESEGDLHRIADSGSWVQAPVESVPQWTHAKRMPEAVAILLARGAEPRRCTRITTTSSKAAGDPVVIGICRQVIAMPGPHQWHCSRHLADPTSPREARIDRADREIVNGLLRGVAVALGIDEGKSAKD
jgi:hypothetical protein